MTSRAFLVGYVRADLPGRTRLVPDFDARDAVRWAGIDLQDGRCLVIADYDGAASALRTASAHLVDLGAGEDPTATLTTVGTDRLSKALGVQGRVKDTIGALLAQHPALALLQPEQGTRRHRIRLNGHLLHDRPAIGGGAFSDDFNRANGALGANWGVDVGSITIVSNKAHYAAAPGTDSSVYYVNNLASANHWSQIDVTLNGVYNEGGALTRLDSAVAEQMYAFEYDNGPGTTVAYNFWKAIAGTWTQLGSTVTGGSYVGGVTATVYLESNGSTHVGKIGGVTQITQTDATSQLVSTLKIGFELYENSGGTAATDGDNFTGDVLAGASTKAPPPPANRIRRPLMQRARSL